MLFIDLIKKYPMKKLNHTLGFSRQSYALFSIFLLTCFLIVYVWWPLVVDYLSIMDGSRPWYDNIDWLLLGIFGFMSLSIMIGADLKTDSLIILVGLCGGLVIESWGTQTNLWHYYTSERPPLWIIPAWPIASLSIDRITRGLGVIQSAITRKFAQNAVLKRLEKLVYLVTFTGFYILMLYFVFPTIKQPYTVISLLICAGLILTPPDRRKSLLVFMAGSALGYFLERWGTTRECWMYYTNQKPPIFAVFAHGMAAVAFWRAGILLQMFLKKKARELRMYQQKKVQFPVDKLANEG